MSHYLQQLRDVIGVAERMVADLETLGGWFEETELWPLQHDIGRLVKDLEWRLRDAESLAMRPAPVLAGEPKPSLHPRHSCPRTRKFKFSSFKRSRRWGK